MMGDLSTDANKEPLSGPTFQLQSVEKYQTNHQSISSAARYVFVALSDQKFTKSIVYFLKFTRKRSIMTYFVDFSRKSDNIKFVPIIIL